MPLLESPTLQAVLPDLPLGHIVPQSTGSSETLSWINRQLNYCNEKHGCIRQHAKQPNPTRLVCVKDGVRLIQNAETPVRYVCLSHCWGGNIPAQTLSSNVDKHLQSIPWLSLPLTFQDTIQLIRALDIDYVWIDSLCIIQDDEVDWGREAARMAEIYQNAYLVVSATSAENAHGGLFRCVEPSFKPVAIDVEGCDEKVYFQKSFSHISSFVDRRLNNSTKLPTLTRAWILQERLLASRVLHFGPQELMWECLHGSVCQCREPLSASDMRDDVQHTARLKEYFSARNWSEQSHQSLIKSWQRLVGDYSQLNITFERDIFPAVSGIAKAFQNVKKSKYVAGLWETSLLEDLAWHVEAAFDWGYPLEEWRAPSWSWASTSSHVAFVQMYEGLEPFCSLINASVTLAGPDPTGEITEAHLLIKGYLVRTTIEHVDTDAVQRTPWNTVRLQVLKNMITNIWADYNCTLPGPNYLKPDTDVECLLIGKTVPSQSLIMLILQQQGPEFRRIGLAQVTKPPNRDTGLTSWLCAFASDNDHHEQMIKII